MGFRKRHKKNNLTEEKIQGILDFQYMSSPKYIMENLFVFDWESDFLVKTKSGYWHEVEIKISFADFKNDNKNKKQKFDILNGTYIPKFDTDIKYRPNYFSYCVTEDIVEKVKTLLPSFAGLYYIDEKYNRLVNVRAPQKLHGEKITDECLKLTDKFYYNYRHYKSLQNNHTLHELKEKYNNEIQVLKDTNKWLRAEYKAVAGCDIEEAL